jgi:hypothetical protein
MPPKFNVKRFNELCTELLEIDGGDPDRYISDVMKGIGAAPRDKMNEHENMAITIASLIVPLIGNVITKQNTPTVKKIEAATRVNRYKIDELEQYGRRENLRINGIKEDTDENVKQKVVDLGKAMGIDVTVRDLNVAHRLGKPGMGAARSIIARFLYRDVKHQFLVNKKQLKASEHYKHVFINEDLTPLRQAIFYKLRKSDKVESCVTRDGSMRCRLKDGKQCVINNPDDLFHAGFDDVDYKELRLNYLDF